MSQIVRCPKCNNSVSVADHQAGTRVQCPSCVQSFLAPATVTGGPGETSEDQDWLSLAEETPEQPAPKPVPVPVPTDSSSDIDDGYGFADEPLAPKNGEVAEVEILENPTLAPLKGIQGEDDLFADLPPIDSASPAVTPQAEQPEFRVKCGVCDSVLYARVSQVGSKIRCPDCSSEITVPEPPKAAKMSKPASTGAAFTLSDPQLGDKPADPYRRSADDLMREAEEEEDKPDEERFTPAYELPDTLGWFKSVFGIFTDLGVLLHLMGLSVLIAFPAALTFSIPMFALAAFPLALLGVTLTASCAFAILNAVANEMDRVEDWPIVDPPSWFESLALVGAAIAIAVGPAYMISVFFQASAVFTIGFVMFTVYVAFPFVLLSMLDMQSVTSPFSPDVAKSVTKCQEDWGTFYFCSGVLFACFFSFCFFSFEFGTPSAGKVAIAVVLGIITVFLYFAMLGRLAVAIGEVVELPALESETEEENDG